MTRTVPVLAHTRRIPEKKETVAFARTTARLFEEVRTRDLADDIERALKEALEVDGGLAAHLGMVD